MEQDPAVERETNGEGGRVRADHCGDNGSVGDVNSLTNDRCHQGAPERQHDVHEEEHDEQREHEFDGEEKRFPDAFECRSRPLESQALISVGHALKSATAPAENRGRHVHGGRGRRSLRGG